MTTIILTIIGILLAAAAALMVIFYGGDAFSSGSVGAQANTVQNAGTNVVSALQMYRAETGSVPTDLTLAQLTTTNNGSGTYLDEEPALPGNLADSLSGGRQYQVAAVPANICKRINANLKVATAPTAPTTGVKMACALATTDAATGTFFANS